MFRRSKASVLVVLLLFMMTQLLLPINVTSSPDTLTLRPNAAGTYQAWSTFGTGTAHWDRTSDQSDATGVQITGSTTSKETENLANTTQTGTINSVTAYMRAKESGATYSTITFVAASGKAAGTGAVTPALPTGVAVDDICILVATTIAGGSVSITTAGGGAWTALTGSPIDVTGGEKLYVWWRRHASGDSAPTVTPGSDHCCAGIAAWRNCISSGSPIDVSATGTETTSDTSLSFVTGISTTADGCMVLLVSSTGTDSNTAQHSSQANADLASINERMDYNTNSGDGGGFEAVEGYKATAGAIGTWTATLTTASPKAYISFALKPDNPAEQAVILWRTYSTDYESSAITISRTTFTDYSQTKTTNPNTGSAWTWTEVNALEIGSRASTLGSGETIQVSEYWIVVDYTAVAVDVAVTNVTRSPTTVYPGQIVTVNATVQNQGDSAATFNVTAYYDSTQIGKQLVSNLGPGASTTKTFSWDTTGVAAGTYTIKAIADTLPGETDTVDNTFIDGTVTVKKATVAVSPSNVTGPPPSKNQIFYVNVTITDALDLYSWQAGMTFNASVLQAINFTEGPFLKLGGTTLYVTGTIDNVNGKIYYHGCTLTGPVPGVPGSGTLGKIFFNATNYGESNLNLTDVAILDSTLTAMPRNVAHGYFKLPAPVNQPPVLDPIGSKTVNELELLTFTATASDPENDPLTFSLGGGAPAGASINATSGVFTWTPTEAQGPGDYTIRVIVSDGYLTDYEDVSVTVYEVNVAPVLDPIGAKSVNELVLLTFTATASDTDLPAQTLTFSLGAGAPTGASINATTGVFTWTPTEAQGPGVYTIRIKVSDGSLEDYEDISVTVTEVNSPPVLDPIGAKSVNELVLLTFTATASDSDIPAQTLTFSLGGGAPAGASINSTTGVFTWTPTEAQGPGVYTVRIIVSDGSLTDYEDVSITVSEVNSAPVLDPIGPKSVNELTQLTFTATASDSDIPAQTLTFSLGGGAPAGASINATTGVFTWTPTEAQGPGVYTVRIIVSDGTLTDYEDVEITVSEVNVAPVLDTIGPKSVNELVLLTFTATASDSDIPAQTLTFSLGGGAPAGASINSTSGVFTWTPTEAQGPGVYTIRVIVSDGTLTDYEDVSVTVSEVNSAPVLDSIGDKSVNELVLLTFTATASDSDIPAQTLTFSLGGGAPAGASINSTTGVFTWTPTEAQGPGSYGIRIIVSDGSLQDYEDITVTVYEVNSAPVLDAIGPKSVDELVLLTFTATATDSDIPAQTLTFSLGGGAPAGASINATTGVFTWTPTEAQGPGVYTVRIIVSDGSLTDFEDVSVTVYEVNVAPVLDSIGPKSVNELTLLAFTATATDSDIPAQTLTFSLGGGAPAGASINSTTGAFTWTPTEAQGPGVYTIRVIVSDGSLQDYEDISVTVSEVNLAPVLDPIGNKTIDELNLLTFTATASDPDIPAQALTFSLGGGAPAGASINSTSGVFTWTPTEAQGPGVYPIRIIVSDGTLQDYEDIWVTVNDVNNPPVLDPIGPKTVDELQLLTFTATASDPDIPAQTLTFSLGGGAPAGASINATSGVFTWTPTEAQGPGVYTIRIIVSDGTLTDYEDIGVTVYEVNVAPVLDPIGSKSVNELELLTFTATASDSDLPAQTLTFSLGGGAPAGASINPTTGVFTWTPTEAQGPGDYTIRIIVSDGTLEDYEDITVSVSEVNLAPVLDFIGNKTIDELTLLTFTATASDPDIPAQALTFSLGAGAPEGASINSTSGVFAWTPTEAQGPGVYEIRIIVSDGTLTDYEDIWVTVNEVLEVHDVAVLSVAPSATEAYPTWTKPLNVTVVVENQGDTSETFNVTAYANSTVIGTIEVTLASGANTTLVFSWNLSGVSVGTYTIRAEADVVTGETETGDNTLTDGTVRIKQPGDANGDGVINVYDLGIVGQAWTASGGTYDPRADFNGDGVIDDLDLAILQANWP